MKKLILSAFLMLSVGLMSCSDKEEKAKVNEENTRMSETGDQEKSRDENLKEMNEGTHETEMASGTFMEKVENGDIILLTENGEPQVYEFEGTTIKTLQMPDGKFHQVIEDGDELWMPVPDNERMQIIRLNNKIYLFDDDDQAYEVKVLNDELVAETTTLTDELLAIDKK